jgi:Transmembrane protein 43
MRHQYTSVRRLSWGEKVQRSWRVLGAGSLFISAAIYILHWNETRVNMEILAHESVDVNTAGTKQGKLVSVTGPMLTNLPLGDDRFLRPGNYAVVDRTVEMYSWKIGEQKQTKKKKLGGSETQTTTYTYTKAWTKDPLDSSKSAYNLDSSRVKYAAMYRNPPKAIPDRLFKVNSARIGRYTVDMNALSYVSNPRSSCTNQATGGVWIEDEARSMYRSIRLRSSDALTLIPSQSQQQRNSIGTSKYIFQGLGSPQFPQVGDVRVCYAVMPVGSIVTVFGRLDQSQITVYPFRDVHFLRLIPGNRVEALRTLGNEEIFWKWAWRFGGFGFMWVGIRWIGYPIVVLLDFFPWLGWIMEILQEKFTPVLALIATIATIILSSPAWEAAALQETWRDPAHKRENLAAGVVLVDRRQSIRSET